MFNTGGVVSITTCLVKVTVLPTCPVREALTRAVMVSCPRRLVLAAKDQVAHSLELEPVGVAR
jgi:hypothetical protein